VIARPDPVFRAYYNASYEGLLGPRNLSHQITAIEKSNKMYIARGGTGVDQDQYKTYFQRRVDIELVGDGPNKRHLIELKSLEGGKLTQAGNEPSALGKIRSKFKPYSINDSKPTYHRQFIMDTLATEGVAVYTEEDEDVVIQKFASEFEWLFHRWSYKGAKKRDQGVPITRSKCKGYTTCLDYIREKQLDMPKADKGLIEYNWGVKSGDPASKTAYERKYGPTLKEFSVVSSGLGNLFDDYPPEIRELEEELNKVEDKINTLQEQQEAATEAMVNALDSASGNNRGQTTFN